MKNDELPKPAKRKQGFALMTPERLKLVATRGGKISGASRREGSKK